MGSILKQTETAKQTETVGKRCESRLKVNAAFLQEIKDSNPAYWQAIHQVRQVCESYEDKRQVSSRLVELLDGLRDHVAMQFALEECYGYVEFPGARLNDDTLVDLDNDEQLARIVRGEHCSLYLELSELAERAEEYQYRGISLSQVGELIERSRQFDARLRKHEMTENELIERSLSSL